jgi:hypothetical protein
MNKMDLDIANMPDTTVNVREVFGIDVDMQVPAYKERTPMSPRLTRIIFSTATRRWRSWPALPTTAG